MVKNSRTETVLNKSYQEMAEHYSTAILLARPRSPKDKAFVEGAVGMASTWILAALRNRQFLSLTELNNAQPHFTQLGYRCFSPHHLFPLP